MITRKKLLLLLAVAAVSFAVGYGTVAKAFPTPYWYGYFYNRFDSNGLEVLPPWGGPGGCQGNGWAIPSWVNTPSEFTNYIVCKLSGNNQNHIGAAFIISTMTGMKNPNPGAAEINEFVARVNYAASQGWINFGAGVGCVLPNTYYQDGPGDVAGYGGCPSGPPDAITFWNGSSYYIIKRFCANPVGSMAPLHDNLDFNMSATAAVNNSSPIPGNTIRFDYTVRNNGPTDTSPTHIWWAAVNTLSGAQTIAGHDSGTYWVGRVDALSENVTIPPGTAPGTQYCRRVDVVPANTSGVYTFSPVVCATVRYDFSLTPSINAVITSTGGPITGNVAEPGDTIAFTYAVNNTGTTVSQSVTCTYKGVTNPGYNQTPPSAVFTPGGANCPPPRTFPYGANTTTATEPAVPAATSNTTICRSFTVTPATPAGGTRTANACVLVAVKPYARTYGGDISAGGGLVTTPSAPTSCAQNSGAAIIGWNRRAGGSYAGAGVQYAAYALSTIFDTATSLGNAGGTVAPVPAGLAFSNSSTNVANGIFGGSFGSVACVQDYWSTKPASPSPLPAALGAGLATGAYGATGSIQLGGGSVNPGTKVSIYVDGNLFIGSNITYAGSGGWTSGTVPMLRVVVRGNIFISRGVTQLDGLYVAQPNGASGGIIYTCALPAAPFTPMTLTGTLASQCNPKLTVNGGVVAKQLWLLRTLGTLRSANAAEASSSGNIAEVFNYNPMLWISQPNDASTASEYDAITSLPPVL